MERIESEKRKDGLVDDRLKKKVELEGSKIEEGVPIILILHVSQVLIYMHNAKEFLEGFMFLRI